MAIVRLVAFLVILLAAAAGSTTAQGTLKQGITRENSNLKPDKAKQPGQGQETVERVQPTADKPSGNLSEIHTAKNSDDIETQRKLVAFTKWLAVVGGLQFLALTVQAIVFWRTLNQVKAQANLMRVHAEHLENLVGAAKANAEAARDNATAAKDGAESAKANANATQENIELIIKKERATLVFELNDIEWNNPPLPPFASTVSGVTYKVRFFGYTPAFIIGTSVWAFVDASKEPPTEGTRSSMPIPKIVSSDTEFPVQKVPIWPIFWDSAQTEAVREKRSFIHFHGCIRYKDQFDKQRETTIKCRWEESSIPGLGGKWITYGKPEDNRQT